MRKKFNNHLPALAFAVAACAAFADNVVTNTFTMTAANTPITAYDYRTPGNWQYQDRGAPMGALAQVTFNASADASAPYFVKLPDDFKISALYMNKGAFLLGSCLKFSRPGSPASFVEGDVDYPYGGIIFGDLKVTKRLSSDSLNAMRAFELAGHFRPGAYEGGTDGTQQYAHTGLVTLRHDLFADSANPVREGAYHYSMSFLENGGFVIYGPKGAPANDSSWNLTANEVYAEYAGTGDHAVVPGQVVTGTGVQPGTFVRYVFPGTKWIALSAPATSSASAASLHFDAITPSVVEYWPEYYFQAGNGRTWALAKFREEDGLKMIVSTVKNTGVGRDSSISRIGLTADQVQNGFIPGEMVVTNFTFNNTVKIQPIYLRNCRLELVNPFSWYDALDQNLGPDGIRFELEDASRAELTIPEGKTVDLKAFCNLRGTLVKKGAGTLVVPMFNTTIPGTIEVAEGTLDLRRGTAIANQPLQLGSLKLASGTTFVVPGDGLTVTSLDAVAGSTISGGILTVINRPVNGLPALVDGAELTFRFGYAETDVFPASSLRLHFDASVASSITTNSTGGITRWDDLSGSGDYLVNNGRTGGVSEYATNRFNTANGLPMVDLGPFCWTNAGPGKATEKDRSFYLKKSDGSEYTKAEADAGALYFPNCKTALCVIDSRYGGGPLIGQPGHISQYPNYTPFPCGIRGIEDWEDQQDARYYAHSDLMNGGNWWGGVYSDASLAAGYLIFRVNGESKNPSTSKFTGGFEIVSYAYAYAEKFGCFGLGTWAYGRTANGLMYGEVVVFSNKLSLAEIELAERYLKYKWANADDPEFYNCVSADAISLGAGSTLSGVNGHAFATAALSGSGTVAGDLTLESGGTISVAANAGGAIAGTTVAGKLTLGPSFRVVVGGSVKPEIGIYRICSAENVVLSADSISGAAVPFPGDSRHYKVSINAEGINLSIMNNGLSIYVR